MPIIVKKKKYFFGIRNIPENLKFLIFFGKNPEIYRQLYI